MGETRILPAFGISMAAWKSANFLFTKSCSLTVPVEATCASTSPRAKATSRSGSDAGWSDFRESVWRGPMPEL